MYHDVSAVVAETMVQGADIMAIKVINWEEQSLIPKECNKTRTTVGSTRWSN